MRADAQYNREVGDGVALAIVIPARNEMDRLPAVIRSLPSRLDGIGRIQPIVVDDGSADGTAAVARDTGAICLRHRVNLGKGGALLTGCEAALRLRCDLIALMDADGQHAASDLPAFITPLVRDEADVVLGARQFTPEMPMTFRVGNQILNATLRLFFGIAVRDSQCGYRAFKASVFETLRWRSRDYAVESEMLIRIARGHLRWSEVQIATVYHDRYKGTQPLDGLRILRQVILWRLGA
jgi:glycosyltransferase involved in cell wall biosynthesis